MTRHRKHPLVRAAAIGLLALLLLGIRVAQGAGMLSASEVTTGLGTLSEVNRLYAITRMVSDGQIRAPLSSSDGAAILQGTTGLVRSGAIHQLASLLNADLSAQEAEVILGPTLSEGNRRHAILVLVSAKRLRSPLSEEDAALLLKGITQGNRAVAIGVLAPYLRANLPGLAIATILGRNGELTEFNRFNAIVGLASAGKLRACLSGDDMNLIMLGVTGPMRVTAIAAIADSAKPQCVTTVFSSPAVSPSISASTAGSTPAFSPGVTSYCGPSSSAILEQLIPEYFCFNLVGLTAPSGACAVGGLAGWKPVHFGTACRAHDECYSRKGANKSECDDSLLSLLRATCDETLTGFWRKLSRAACYDEASFYYRQVRLRACEAFTNAQKQAGISNPSCSSPSLGIYRQ